MSPSPTLLKTTRAMTPAEYAQALADYNTGPGPQAPDAPFPEEQALVDAQGDRIARDRLSGDK